jgi:hypothetical protein
MTTATEELRDEGFHRAYLECQRHTSKPDARYRDYIIEELA